MQPRSLACGHTFCHFCLVQWKAKTTARQVCPFCRERFRGDGHKNFVLESLLSAWEAKLGEEEAAKRKEAVEERRADEEAFKNKKAAPAEKPVAGPSTSGAGMITAYFAASASGVRATRSATSAAASSRNRGRARRRRGRATAAANAEDSDVVILDNNDDGNDTSQR